MSETAAATSSPDVESGTTEGSNAKDTSKSTSVAGSGEEVQICIDTERLLRTVRESGEDAAGICAVEVWVLEEDGKGFLVRPAGGWWRHATHTGSDFARLEDKTHPEYVPADPVLPGVDIAGKLWSESSSRGQGHGFRRMGSRADSVRSRNISTTSMSSVSWQTHHVHWRSLQSILADPDNSHTARMKLLVEAGLEEAAAVRFSSGGLKGIVIYYAGSSSNNEMMKMSLNEMFMVSSAEVIGTVVANGRIRGECLKQKDSNMATSAPDSPKKQPASSQGNMTETMTKNRSFWEALCVRFKTWLRKTKGGNLQPPPAMSWHETCFTFFGCIAGLVVFELFVQNVTILMDGGFHLLGPIGALMCLQYAVPGSPATQPFPTVMGQAVSGLIGVLFAYLPYGALAMWYRQLLAPALAIAAMAKLRITHPPAGATAIILASQPEPLWKIYACVMIVTTATLVPAVFVNNLSQMRQFPTYWTLKPKRM